MKAILYLTPYIRHKHAHVQVISRPGTSEMTFIDCLEFGV